MELFCENKTFFKHVDSVFIFIEIILFLASLLLFYKLSKRALRITGRLFKKTILIILSLAVSFFVFLFLTMFCLWSLWLIFPDDNPPSADYHVLNAAIKNTCFLDPQRNHCPKTAQDIINIEPERFTKLTKDAHLTYEYYPESNQYTLIIRDENIRNNNYRVVIFDPRLSSAEDYSKGLDFVDADVSICNGKFVLDNPPPFNGPWDKIN